MLKLIYFLVFISFIDAILYLLMTRIGEYTSLFVAIGIAHLIIQAEPLQMEDDLQ